MKKIKIELSKEEIVLIDRLVYEEKEDSFVDYYSVEEWENGTKTHRGLLEKLKEQFK